jgi:FAD/FMN-containing dehydrogenase
MRSRPLRRTLPGMGPATDITMTRTALDGLRSTVQGTLLLPGEHGYDDARTVWNAMIDRRPAVIVRVACVADVIAAVRFARDHDLLFSVRGGGHNVTGSAVADGGLMLDMSAMKQIVVDPDGRTATAEPGCLWSDLDAATQEFGLAVTGGQASDTGIAGLTLGGGVGQLMRYCGATVDNLVAVELVTADGQELTVSVDEHPDLFWAVRGGGGNFGVVTSFVYRLHPVGPIILGGLLLYPATVATDFLAFYRDWMAAAPDELIASPNLLDAPPESFVPEELRLQPAVGVQVCYVGDVDEGRRLLTTLTDVFPPSVDMVAPMPYTVHQQLNDPGTPWGRQVYLKSANLRELSDPVIEIITRFVAEKTSPLTMVPINPWGGAISRVADDATAFGHRDTKFTIYIFTMWEDPADSERHIAWSRAFHDELRPYMNGIYVNEMGPDERVHDAYSPATLTRLADVKTTYDPTNFFRMNQNIKPAS